MSFVVSLLLGHTHRGHGRISEGDPWQNIGVVATLVAVDGIFCCQLATVSGHVDIHISTGDITYGVYVGITGLQIIIHEDLTVLAKAHAGRLQTHVRGIGPPAGCHEQGFAGKLAWPLHASGDNAVAALVFLHFPNENIGLNRQPFIAQIVG